MADIGESDLVKRWAPGSITFSDTVIGKARDLLAAKRVSADPTFFGIWWAESSDGQHNYRIQSDYSSETGKLSWITCTCPYGLMAGAGTTRCYHAAAVLILLREVKR